MTTIINIASLRRPSRGRSGAEEGAAPGCGPPGGCDLRCDCGSLLARLVDDAVELKCRRCKRSWRIPVEAR
jgi:hypothetical protein